MFELYLDTADIGQIIQLNRSLPLKGVTTNPSILAKSGIGLNNFLHELKPVLGQGSRFHVQVVSSSVDEMVKEGVALARLPYDIVVKVPATETGLSAIKRLKKEGVKVLATAIYSVQQGFLAALCGVDYLAPYVNRIDMRGESGLEVVESLQHLIDLHTPECKILAASFKSPKQALEVIERGVEAITLPPDIARLFLLNNSVDEAVEVFHDDWRKVFDEKLSFQS